jgi:hypothetical protein
MFMDIYTSVKAHEFIASLDLYPGCPTVPFSNPTPIMFDPAPHGPESAIWLMYSSSTLPGHHAPLPTNVLTLLHKTFDN